MSSAIDTEYREAAQTSKSWPFEEARRLIKRMERMKSPPEEVIFQTGYGPSGLPHIGTFGEVARTTMVRNAFALLTGMPTRLICFSDDMDGLRKVPDNLPNAELLEGHLGMPLSRVPDPFGEYESFAHHNNARLRSFLDVFEFDYEFYSATECYKSGLFDATLLKMLSVYDSVIDIILPTLGEERQKTYSPFLPICPETGAVLQEPVVARDIEKGTISYKDPKSGELVEVPVTGHNRLFDATLLKMLSVHDSVIDIILPTLGEERQKTYSPFLPICPETGAVLQEPVVARDIEKGTISYKDPKSGELVEVPVTGGHVKCQWKADWALRWAALHVDYEMAGKDLIDSVRLSSRICKALGGVPPEGFNYELFLDENGEKISKSRGNGLTIDEWLKYASPESLSLFMYQKPKTAKRLYFDVIPKNVDEYLTFLSKFKEQDAVARLQNPAWHIHNGNPPEAELAISFNLLLNLVNASNSEDAEVLWGFIQAHAPGAGPETHPELDKLVGYAIAYFHDFVKPQKQYRLADDKERAAFLDLAAALENAPEGADGQALQSIVYEVGKAHEFENLRDWFRALYEVLLGQSQGPRFGSFIELYGVDKTIKLIRDGLDGKLIN